MPYGVTVHGGTAMTPTSDRIGPNLHICGTLLVVPIWQCGLGSVCYRPYPALLPVPSPWPPFSPPFHGQCNGAYLHQAKGGGATVRLSNQPQFEPKCAPCHCGCTYVRARTHGGSRRGSKRLGSEPNGPWVLFRTPKMIINYLGWTSPVFF